MIRSSLTEFLEKDFLNRVLGCARKAGLPADYEFWFLNGYEKSAPGEAKYSKNSVLFIFDESQRLYPHLYDSCAAIFQTHIGSSKSLGPRHFTFPLGLPGTFLTAPWKNVADRNINVFFCGNLHKGRAQFHRWLSGWPLPFPVAHRLQHWTGPNFDRVFQGSYIRFTQGFMQGLSAEVYSAMLGESKIALCPRGIQAAESFRVYEALASGCIVFADGLPSTPFLDGSPILRVEKWDSNVSKQIRQMLNDLGGAAKLSLQSAEWAQSVLSDEHLGRYIRTCLMGLS